MIPRLTRIGGAPRIRRAPVFRKTFDFPPVTSLAVICCYYNPMDCPLVRRNALQFLSELDAPAFVVDLSFDGRFDIPAATLQINGHRDTQLLWQKERLLNLVEREVPAEFDAIAWVDMDVLFHNPEWNSETLHMLSRSHVGQLWTTAWERHDDSDTVLRPSVCHGVVSNDPLCFHLGHYHPGFAWAMRRDTWRKIGGLLDNNVVGNGDTHMCRGFLNSELWTDRFMSRNWRAAADQWKYDTHEIVQGHIGCVSGRITHLWHGDRQNRRYVERLSYLGDHDFDPATDLQSAANGLLEWTPQAIEQKPEMIAKVRGYFDERRLHLHA